MSFLIPLYLGYVAYQQHERLKLGKYDETISLEGKTVIPLSKQEQSFAIYEFPMTTITFCDGNYQNIRLYLQQRIADIIAKNPWMGGWLIRDVHDDLKVKIYYDKDGKDLCQGHFQVLDNHDTVVSLSRDKTKYTEYPQILQQVGALLPGNSELIGKDRPFWKVSVIPDCDAPQERFALVMSLSHAVGDIQTYYKLYQMLDKDATIDQLDPTRDPNYQDRLVDMIGEKEATYFRSAIQNPIIDLTGASDEKCVFKLFYVDPDWILTRKSRRASVFDPETTMSEASVVSANSTLTSWFFNLNQASIGLMSINLRSRLDGCEIGNLSAGNYVHPIIYQPSDYQTPGLIQESVKGLRRCGPEADQDLPDFGWNMTSSLSINWATYFHEELYLHDDVQTKLHIPLLNVPLLRKLPNRVSLLLNFTANPNGIDGSERRTAAFVICRESVWEQIKKSGIIEEMIAEDI